MNKPLVTIIIPTTCSPYAETAVGSVLNQSYDNIQCLLVKDGFHDKHVFSSMDISHELVKDKRLDFLALPYNTGSGGYNGHRIYGACTYLAKGDYVCFLDEDNWLESNHIDSLVTQVSNEKPWSYSLRKIIDKDGNYICNDDCESLGKWASVLNDNFVDVNCFFLHKMLALKYSPIWYRRARNPNEQPEVDRYLSWLLFKEHSMVNCTGLYTVNYRAGNTSNSVQKDFFLNGNNIMNKKYNGEFPWRKI